jgi:hypothetical protein
MIKILVLVKYTKGLIIGNGIKGRTFWKRGFGGAAPM